MYHLEIAPGAGRDIEKLKQRTPRQDFERLRKAITKLADEPRPHGVQKIRGTEGAYRIRVGSYRVVYGVYEQENIVLILQVARRTEATYR